MTEVQLAASGHANGLFAEPSAMAGQEAFSTFAPESASAAIKPENEALPPVPLNVNAPLAPSPFPNTDARPAYNGQEEETNGSIAPGQDRGRLSAYAKLELVDGSYYMNTISVVVGRDIEVGREAKRQAVRVPKVELGGEAPNPFGDDARSVAKSAISESGGLLGLMPRKRKRKSKTGSSASDRIKEAFQYDQTLIHDGSPDLNMDDLLPDPYEEPLVAIHEPVQEDGSVSVSRGISRKHVRIAYSYQLDCFQMTVLGRNGVFLDGEYYGKDKTVDLQHGNEIQISGVFIKFMLPVEAVSNGDDQISSSGHVSHIFEDSEGGNLEAEDMEDFEDLPPEQRFNNSHLYHAYNSDSDEDSEPAISIEDDTPKAPRLKLKIKQQAAAKQRAADRETARKVALKQSKAPNGKIGKTKLTKAERRLKRKAEQEARRKRKKEREVSEDADEEEDEQEEPAEEEKEEEEEEEVVASVETASKKPSKMPAKIPAKMPAKVPASTPAKMPAKPSAEPPKPSAVSPTEGSTHLVARETDFVNGENGIIISNLPIGAIIPARKKGPGRPPKDGLMSKREKALINKHMKEVERAKKLGLDPSQVAPLDLATSKPTRPRLEGNEVSDSAVPMASSVPPQLHSGDQSNTAEKTPRQLKPEEPSQPEMKESDYSAEQLAKPSANYAVMLYDILKEHGRLNLQQIYEVMERKFPYFKFKAGTSGWQSSVRHNLGQNDIFRKAEKDGKGYSWELNPDKQIEPPRKVKKQNSPPVQPSHSYGGYPRPYPNLPAHSQQYPQQRPSLPQGAQAPQIAGGASKGSATFSGNYSSPYNNTQQQANGAAAHPSNMPAQPGQRREPVWSRDTLIKTVYKIYAPRLGPSPNLQEICEHAVDWFLHPTDMQKANMRPPEGKELEILKALRDAHAAQEKGTPVGTSPAPAQSSASPAPSAQQSVDAKPQTASTYQPTQSAISHSSTQKATYLPKSGSTTNAFPPSQGQSGPMSSTPLQTQAAQAPATSGPSTPQAPQPEPLTRPSSSQGPAAQERSNTPPVEPPVLAASKLSTSSLPSQVEPVSLSPSKSTEIMSGTKRERSNSIVESEAQAKRVKEDG